MSVSPELWQEVVDRDAGHLIKLGLMSVNDVRRGEVVCIVLAIDPLNPIPCGGKQEVDHVKDQLMMGKRAPDDEAHLVAMCQEHNTWHPPRKELRRAEREYLKGNA